MNLFAAIAPYKTVCLAGMCKNAGKTTALKSILEADRGEYGPLGLTSIGRDGEREDVVTGTKKPPLYVREGTLVATAEGLLPLCDISTEILEQTGFFTPLGEVLLVRALSAGYVQIGGPSMASQLVRLNRRFFAHGAGKVLLDGALFRKSLCAPEVSEGVILSTGASYSHGMDKTLQDTAFAVRMLTLPLSQRFSEAVGERQVYLNENGKLVPFEDFSKIGNPSALLLMGAVTDKRVEGLLTRRERKPLELCCEDGTKLFLSSLMVQKLERAGVYLRVLKGNTLAAVTVNPFSDRGTPYDPKIFYERMDALLPVPVVNVEAQR